MKHLDGTPMTATEIVRLRREYATERARTRHRSRRAKLLSTVAMPQPYVNLDALRAVAAKMAITGGVDTPRSRKA